MLCREGFTRRAARAVDFPMARFAARRWRPVLGKAPRRLAIAIVLAVAMPTSAGSAGVVVRPTVRHPKLVVEPYVTGLDRPTAFVFTGPDSLLVAEKNSGRVRRVENGQIVGTAIDLAVNFLSERGALGIALDPNFEGNGRVYVYYSAAEGGDGSRWARNSVTRFRFDGRKLTDPVELLAFPQRSGVANGPNHDGGPMRFGPDGYLYGLTGDLNRGGFGSPAIEQNTGEDSSSDVGGIFRIAPDGSIPADNPFADHPVRKVRRWFVYGVRNSFGMAFDPVTGRLWFTENGPSVYDEINVAVSGGNSGWRKLMGPDRRDATYGANGNQAFDAADLTMLPGAEYIDPVFSWLEPIGVTAMTFLNSERLPRGLRDRLVVGDANTGDLYLFEIRGKRRRRLSLGPGLKDRVADTNRERSRNVWGSGFGVVTDLSIGPDGSLYVLGLQSETLWRVRWPGAPSTSASR